MAIPINSIVELSFRGTLFNQTMLTVRHYQSSNNQSGVTVADDLNAFLDAVDNGGPNDLVTPYLNCCGPEYVLDEIRAQVVKTLRSVPRPRTVGAAGTFGSVITAQNVSGVITLTTSKAGRSQIGRVHMPALPIEAYSGGNITGPYSTLLNTLGGELLRTVTVALGGGAYIPVLYHRTLPIPQAGDLIETRTIQTTLRVMRRRTVGVGK